MLFDTFSGWVAKWWWLITLIVVVVILLIPGKRSHRQNKKGHSSGTGPEQRRVGSRSSGAQLRPAHRVETPTFPAHWVDSHTIRARWVESPTRTITGKAYVTDGDGIRVARKEVRLAGLDAPEWDQKAKHQNGYWFNHGRRVKSALIQKIGGKHVSVAVESVDKFGRIVGTVTCEGRDIGEWMVREGLAIAAYHDRYRQLERGAREAKRGMWAHAHNFDPRAHRHRERSLPR